MNNFNLSVDAGRLEEKNVVSSNEGLAEKHFALELLHT